MTAAHTTTLEEFRALAESHRVVPVVRSVLADTETPVSAYIKLANGEPGTFLFESAEHGHSWSRWSFIGCGAPAHLGVKDGQARWFGQVPQGAPEGGDPLQVLRETLEILATNHIPGLPPLTSGMVGFLSYDIVRRLEKLPETTTDDLEIPELMLLLATDIAAVDHHQGRIHLIANAVNWNGTSDGIDQAYAESVRRLDVMAAKLTTPAVSSIAEFDSVDPDFTRKIDRKTHLERIDRIVEDIYAGEAFQVVLSQRFEMDTTATPLEVYRILRTTNPSPYMYLLNVPDGSGDDGCGGTAFTVVGSSPEALVTVTDRLATTHPIAGTRWRGATEEDDILLEKNLLADEKENAEHLMLVDLGRNDLGRVCVPGTVTVTDFSRVERYSHVMHLVSTVTGQLTPEASSVDAVTACFPAGTLSGAPKPRALEIIEREEQTRRGIYGGTIGYFDFAGNADHAIAIRTGVFRGNRVFVQAGGGIVADSDPGAEDDECRNKAMAVLRAVATAQTLRPVSGDSASDSR